MTFAVQDDAGSVVGANAYITTAFFDSYHADRGNPFTATSTQREQAIVRATDYMDVRFRFVGLRLLATQTTEWPRSSVVSPAGDDVEGIPLAVEQACADYALQALLGPLMPVPVAVDDSGRLVISKEEAVAGAVSEKVVYSESNSVQLRAIPSADNRLRISGLLASGGSLIRG